MTAALRIYADPSQFSEDQANAMDLARDWHASWPAANQYFAIGGYAGTGKTTILAALSKEFPNAAIVAPTGKAVNRLQMNKLWDAQTIHSLLYIPYESYTSIEECKWCAGAGTIQDEQCEACHGTGEIEAEKPKRSTKYKKRTSIDAEVIICDEASMVNSQVMNDMLTFSKPILFFGDHGQLEPIGENPGIMTSPDVRLERIHRQAEGNPIIRLAQAFREGREADVRQAVHRGSGRWQDAEKRCIVTRSYEFDDYLDSGMQVICGFNKTRHKINKEIRARRGYQGVIPNPGERIICLQNNRDFCCFNGQQATVVKIHKKRKRTVDLEIDLDGVGKTIIPCLIEQFGKDKLDFYGNQDFAQFDYAYAITAHKAQGSEWDGVIVLEEISRSWNRARWQYTTTTRAKERIVYCF